MALGLRANDIRYKMYKDKNFDALLTMAILLGYIKTEWYVYRNSIGMEIRNDNKKFRIYINVSSNKYSSVEVVYSDGPKEEKFYEKFSERKKLFEEIARKI
ncbi:hypothetical protein D3C75_678910 [compost metagenome]